ncbi:hypothetical protein CI109_100500 [Kwoniella shandongensis]|uniref:Uncharacterized protein n=1 Tax=Kwoniella shandongensis TaxID=1734106 RepID=A0A5M6C3M0_9TREE|nr:uncharacterized protein CI109_001657 [Kwoniella shandongensis]KAA5529718.1 hypothetical protein CI109_001657 [Kwoniella shandongensis]
MTSISAPTQLATFAQPHASSSKLPHVRLSPVVGDARSAVAAVQGDGVWTYDLSTLRPTTSYTVPPSTVFSTSPISYWTTRSPVKDTTEEMDVDEEEEEEEEEEVSAKSGKTEKERVTLVGSGKEVWVWRGEEGEKEVVSLSSPVHDIHHLTSSPLPILAVSGSSKVQIHLLDPSFKSHPVSVPTSLGLSDTVLVSRIVSSTEELCKLVLVDLVGKVVVLRVTYDDKRAERVSEGIIGEGKKLTFVDVSQDGVISALDGQSRLHCRDIRELSSSATQSPIHLSHPPSTPALLSLPSAGKPLVLVPTPHPTPSLLLAIPLATLPTVLSSTSVSTFTASGSISHLSVLASRGGVLTVGVVLSHKNSDGESGRSVIYTCEVGLPEKGVGMSMLLGTQTKSKMYLASESALGENKSGAKSAAEKAEDEIISTITTNLKRKDVASAERAWTEWSAKQPVFSEKFVPRIVETIFSAALNDEGKQVGSYAGGVIRDLVKTRVVSDGMWKSGVVIDGLLPCGDWETILLALNTIPTIPSSTVIALIRASLQTSSTTSTTTPTLAVLLREIMSGPSPAPTYRIDLRRELNVEEATSVLCQFVIWAEAHVERRSDSLEGWDVDNESESNPKSASNQEADLPSLESVITHSSLLLDAHLPSFLSYEVSHTQLERLQLALEPLIAIQNDYRKLRGPVEAVLTLVRRENRKAEERESNRKARHGRGGSKKAAGVAGAAGGPNKLPEEVVGKWKVEDLVF